MKTEQRKTTVVNVNITFLYLTNSTLMPNVDRGIPNLHLNPAKVNEREICIRCM